MKRTNAVTKLISILLFIAMAAYIGVYVIRAVSNDIRTAPAVFVELTETTPVTGMIFREETLVDSGEPYLGVVAESGQLLAAKDVIAVSYSGEAALERAGRIRELELQRQYILSAIEGDGNGANVSQRETSIKNAVTELSAAASRHETDAIATASITLASLILKNPDVNPTQEDLNLVTAELESLRQSAAADTVAIRAPATGLFFAATDGYEYIGPDKIKSIVPEELKKLFDEPQDTPATVIGKLASPLDWYYAALVSQEGAKQLKVGESATLDFGRYSAKPLKARVISIKADDSGEFAVVLRFTSAVADMLSLREVSADIIFDTTSGIRVPKEAVYTETEEGAADEKSAFVYTVTGLQAEKKYISIIYETDDYYLVEVAASDASALREGNDIILTKGEIYDGMLLN